VSCLRLTVDTADADLASGALWAHEPIAVAEEAAADGRVSLLAGFADVATAAQVAAALPARWSPTLEAAPADSEWRDAWRVHAEVIVVGHVRLWPAWWEEDPPVFDGVTVRLDPGWAFGSGSHPSTRMALAQLADRIEPGATVLDVGTGSGVLAVAGALLGASSVTAVDTDPEAARVTPANAAANDVADRIRFLDGIPEDGGPFDLVVANIGAAVLTQLVGAVTAARAPTGSIVLGGLLMTQAPAVAAAYRRADPTLEVIGTDEEEGWSTLVLA
jgi:ribosomal protein L11 methyltransferase